MSFSTDETPFHQAVIQRNLTALAALLEQAPEGWKKPNHLGFNALELAEWLDFTPAITLISKKPLSRIKVKPKEGTHYVKLTSSEFEKQFKIRFFPNLIFSSYPQLKKTIRNLPLSYPYLLEKNAEITEILDNHTHVPTHPDLAIQWIDPSMGYGLFSTASLKANTIIGEYTGFIRPINRLSPEINAYCFKYPTRFFSWNYLVIDAQEGGNSLRFINHSDSPNLSLKWVINRHLLHLVAITNQNIPKQTELSMNYGSDYWLIRKKIIN